MRFALALSSVFAIGALSAGGISYVFQTRELTSRLSGDVQSIAQGLAQIAESGDRQDLAEQVRAQALSFRDGTTLVAWIDASTGAVTGNFQPNETFEGSRRLDPANIVLQSTAQSAEIADGYEAFAIRTPLGTVIAARDTAWITESGEILMQSTIWSLGTALILSIGLAIAIARRNERRVLAIEQVLEEVGRGRLDLRIVDMEQDDLARVANNVDATLDRLEATVDSIKQVSTDVAHDLRAPLARLRVKMEPHATDPALPEHLRYLFGAMLTDIDDISGTFESILRLARLQSGSVKIQSEEIDLGALVHEVIEIMHPIAEDAGHALTLDFSPTAQNIFGDRELLTQALINLTDNAIRHCPTPTSITIGVGTDAGGTCLWVADHGPGIPKDQRTNVLERFVRLDRSRSTSGTGLGLSIVQAIATLHGANLSLNDNTPGLRIALLFQSKALVRQSGDDTIHAVMDKKDQP
jgi:signal transduction histidine kinase